MYKKRILKDFHEITKSPPDNCSASPDENNLYHWTGFIFGPRDSPYDGGIFRIEIFLPDDYPYSPPKVNFITKIYHINAFIRLVRNSYI